MARLDPHSFADDTQPETEELWLHARVDFETKVITGEVTLRFRSPGGGAIDLDTRDLTIDRVMNTNGDDLPFVLHPPEPHLGARLSIQIGPPTAQIRIQYRTSPDASALQWLAPAQTKGGQHPFLFSQCQAIHARSLIPLQDTPRLRQRYRAELTFPKRLTCVMAAADQGRTDGEDTATHRFEMPQAIPPYLFAFAIGDLASRDISPRCRVWAEPAVVEAAAWEYADVEAMIGAAEALFGPYDWDRFDILSMPPSFPYGGMENPRLTFITPTVLAGDRSLVSVIAHELAHSWTGNLVTNANAEHFWLNEGFTMYAERRITEALEGPEMAVLSAALGRRELDASLKRFESMPGMTRLRTHLDGVDPDECYSLVPYEKGYFFIAALEAAAGRPAFERWLKTWLDRHRFGAVTTEDFEAHFEAALPGVLAQVNAREWLDGEGIPASAVPPRSPKLDAIEALATAAQAPETVDWNATEWGLYLETLSRPAPHELLKTLDERFTLTASGNYDVLVAWLTLALQSGYRAVLPRVEETLGAVGRMKYLRPLYTALLADPSTKEIATRAFTQHRASYHPIAQQMVQGLL